MKLICERDALHRAISAVVGRARGKTKIIILQHLKLETDGNRLLISATDLDARSDASCVAEVMAKGARCVPAERLAQIIGGMSNGSQVALELKDNELHVRAGRSHYRLPTLEAADFPIAWDAVNPVTFSLPWLDVKALFAEPQPAIKLNSGFLMLEGGCLCQRAAGKISMIATDKYKLICRTVDGATGLKGHYIIPKNAMAEIARMAHEGDIDFVLAENMVSATAGDVTYSSKLIEQEYPISQLERIIPSPDGDSILVDRVEFISALKRLIGLETQYSRIRISWCSGIGELQMSLSGEGSGQEQIVCECDVAEGMISFQSQILIPMVDAFKGDVIRLCPRGPDLAMRICDPADDNLIVMAFPCRDAQAVAIEPASEKATEDA